METFINSTKTTEGLGAAMNWLRTDSCFRKRLIHFTHHFAPAFYDASDFVDLTQEEGYDANEKGIIGIINVTDEAMASMTYVNRCSLWTKKYDARMDMNDAVHAVRGGKWVGHRGGECKHGISKDAGALDF